MKVFFYVLLNLIFILFAFDSGAQQESGQDPKTVKAVIGAHTAKEVKSIESPETRPSQTKAKLYAKEGPSLSPVLSEGGIKQSSLEEQIAALELKLASVPSNLTDEYSGFISNVERLIFIKKNLITIREALNGFFRE